MRPLIGIPLRLDESGSRPGRRRHVLDVDYTRAVDAAGGLALHLPVIGDAAALAARIDGLLLPGGDDFLPDSPYPDSVEFEPVPDEQLAFDRALLDAALARDLPVLGVCYGMQLLALHAGGRLVYDLATDDPSAGEHRLPEPDGRHGLCVERHSLLADVLGDAAREVNSRHHQAVAEAGRGLRVCARAADGVVEAIERAGGTFCLGVQWHPESMDAPHRERLFGAFVESCR